MADLPYGNTTVPVARSIGEIMGVLQEVGFTKTAQYCDNGRYVIAAERDGVQFQWEARTAAIIKVLQPKRRGRRRIVDYQGQADRIAWRILWCQIKVACDMIKYEVQDIAEVFGGNLIFEDSRKGKISLARFIVEQATSGKIQLPRIEAPK
jgi:hypothetical protein